MTRPGVLINANARAAKRDPGLVERLRRLVPPDCVRATQRADEIVPAISALVERGIDALVVVGGDGTLPHTLTPLLQRFDAASLPALVPTLGGTVNTVARSLGARGTPERTVAALLTGQLREHQRAVLRAAPDGGEPLFGFVFVNGVGVRFLDLYYQSALGPRGALSVVSRISASALVGGALARRTFAPFSAELDVDGVPQGARHFTVIAAGAVRHLGLGFAPLYSAGTDPAQIHLATTSASAARLSLELPALRLGARGSCLAHFPCRRAELRLDEPLAWSLDAELLPPARRLELSAGPVLRFLCPPARSA